MVKEVTKYICPYCREEYKEEYEAEDCAKECLLADIDDPDEEDYYRCEMCNEDYSQSSKALECEESHEKKKDKHYQFYIEVKKRELLDIAANHPSQKKLQ